MRRLNKDALLLIQKISIEIQKDPKYFDEALTEAIEVLLKNNPQTALGVFLLLEFYLRYPAEVGTLDSDEESACKINNHLPLDARIERIQRFKEFIIEYKKLEKGNNFLE